MPTPRTPTLPPLGAHMSIAGGMPRAVERALAVGATALQIFLKNNNQWRGKLIDDDEAAAFRAAVAAARLPPVVGHSSYLINLASPGADIARKSVESMTDEIVRAGRLGVAGIVMHPGAHLGAGEQAGIELIARRINAIFAATPGNPAGIWLETTAGQGSHLGWRFEHLRDILERVEDRSRVAVCLDTCHVFAAGHDIRTADGVRRMLAEFDRVIGLNWLRAIHANDSAKPLGSRRDRHAHIGQGEIGEAGFAALLRDRRLRKIPFLLETPKDDAGDLDRMNLATLRRLASPPPAAATRRRKTEGPAKR